MIADINTSTYAVNYIKRPADHTVASFAIKEVSATSYKLAFFVNEQKDDDYKNYNSEGVCLTNGARNLSTVSFTTSWAWCSTKKTHGSSLVFDGTDLLAAFYGGEGSTDYHKGVLLVKISTAGTVLA